MNVKEKNTGIARHAYQAFNEAGMKTLSQPRFSGCLPLSWIGKHAKCLNKGNNFLNPHSGLHV